MRPVRKPIAPDTLALMERAGVEHNALYLAINLSGFDARHAAHCFASNQNFFLRPTSSDDTDVRVPTISIGEWRRISRSWHDFCREGLAWTSGSDNTALLESSVDEPTQSE